MGMPQLIREKKQSYGLIKLAIVPNKDWILLYGPDCIDKSEK